MDKTQRALATSISVIILLLICHRLIAQELVSDEEAIFALIFDGEALPGSSNRDDDILTITAIHVECPKSFKEEFVLSFIREIKTGDVLTRAELINRTEQSLTRLKLSQYFYQATISYSDADGQAEVFVSVSDGFWWVFNFIPWDLMVAYTNIGGSGRILGTQFGLNTQSLLWADPSIHFSPWRYHLNAGHFEGPRSSGFTGDYNLERFSFEALLGRRLSRDNVYLDAIVNLEALRSRPSYWLDDILYALTPSQQELLGLDESFSSWVSGGINLSLGEYSFKKRGGLHGKLILQAQQWMQTADTDNKALKLCAEGISRFNTAGLVRIYLMERFEYLPFVEQLLPLPDPLRVQRKDIRYKSGSRSGDLSSLSRLSIEIDSIWSEQLSFTKLTLIPELWLDAMLIRNTAYDNAMNVSFAFGIMLRGDFSIPIGRSFALGMAINPGESIGPTLQFVFEVK